MMRAESVWEKKVNVTFHECGICVCYTSLGVRQKNLCDAFIIRVSPSSVTSATGLHPPDIVPSGNPHHLQQLTLPHWPPFYTRCCCTLLSLLIWHRRLVLILYWHKVPPHYMFWHLLTCGESWDQRSNTKQMASEGQTPLLMTAECCDVLFVGAHVCFYISY